MKIPKKNKRNKVNHSKKISNPELEPSETTNLQTEELEVKNDCKFDLEQELLKEMDAIENKSKKTIEESIEELDTNARELLKTLDKTSDNIRQIEDRLKNAKFFLPFEFFIKKENSILRRPKEEHLGLDLNQPVHNYVIETSWFFSWETDKKNNNVFRLFLISIKKEILLSCYKDVIENDDLQPEIDFQKPFLETNIQMRLEYSKYLNNFINAFKEYLVKSRNSIEKGKIPF